MLKNYLKIAFRNLIRHKAFSLLNIAGLAIGMTCSIFILLWVQNEVSYDRFHAKADNIYRLVGNVGDFKAAVSPAAMPPGLKAELPQVKNFVRFSQPSTTVFEIGANKFEEKDVFYADSSLFDVFSFPLVKGDRRTALMRSDAVLITEEMSRKYFNKEDPVGKVLRINNEKNVTVTGVLKNIPSNSHLHFDFIMPMSAIAQTHNDIKNNRWDNFNFYSYLLLDKPAAPATIKRLSDQINAIYKRHDEELGVSFQLQPLRDIHLRSDFQADLTGHGDIQYVNIFFLVAIFILVIACINYMNLSTARSARRAKEVGLRKVVGARKMQLVGQFLGESLLISILALIVALAAVWLLLPAFNHLAGKEISIQFLDGKLLAGVVSVALLTGIISGSYPALFLSGFQPVTVLKGNRISGGNKFFRNSLVVTQFAVSIILLAGTSVVYQQLKFIRNMNLGFDKSNLVYMMMKGEMWNKQEALKSELKRNPLTTEFAIVNDIPVRLSSGTVNVQWKGKAPNSQIVFPTLDVSEEFFDVFQMRMLGGRAFSKEFKADTSNYIINETAAKVMGMNATSAVGQPLSMWDAKGTIVGVVKDFNFKPVQQPIEPMILRLNRWGGVVMVRTKPGKTEATINALKNIHTALNPNYPFNFDFLDQNIANQYQGEQKIGSLFNVFAALAIFISCIGLYGLSAFMAEQRTKEIGVRKVMGASVLNVVYLLSTGFTRLILLAIVIAVPLAWWAASNWLNSFAFHISINGTVFVLASLAALAIAWITVSYESVKAAVANPVKSLRSE